MALGRTWYSLPLIKFCLDLASTQKILLLKQTVGNCVVKGLLCPPEQKECNGAECRFAAILLFKVALSGDKTYVLK